jgi:hypothetical protein
VTSVHCSFFYNFPFLLQECIYSPESDDLVWLLFFFLFLVINQHSVKSSLCTFRPSISDACKYSNAKSLRSRVFYIPSTPFSILDAVNNHQLSSFSSHISTPDHDCTCEMQIQH